MPTGIYQRKPFLEETRKKLSKALLGNKNSLGHKCTEETKRKIGFKNKGKKCSNEQKQKISIANKGCIPMKNIKK